MRLCYYNPQSVNIGFGDTVLSFLASIFGTDKSRLRKHNLKYAYLLDLLKNTKYDTAIVVDCTGSSFAPVLDQILLISGNYWIYNTIARIEVYGWCMINGINPLRKPIIFSTNKLNAKRDVLFGFAYCTYNFFNRNFVEKSIFKGYNGIKILHASHYYKSTKLVADNIRLTGVTLMVAEANLKKSDFFNKYFEYVDQVYILSHTLRPRYKKKAAFQMRKNKCLALGTLVLESKSDKSNTDYFKFFKTNTLHPMRKLIYENTASLKNIIDSMITLHNKKRLDIQQKQAWYKRNVFLRFFYDLFFISEGKDYHSFDIVKKYNEYKMFIAPEENIGLSSVNFVEGMACGCAYIGLNHPMYEDLGMIDKVHYIAYDGTLMDLNNKISYYQSHQDELEEIAERGYNFARKSFSEKNVAENFWNYLEKLVKKK